MQYMTRAEWVKFAKPDRIRWARESPMAWILEYQPTILLPGKGQIPLEPYPFQQEFLNSRSRYRAINKPRQCGISTIAAAEVAWEFCNKPGAQIVIVSKDKDAAINFHRYVYNILYSAQKNDPKFPKLVKTNERETTNINGARVTSLAAGAETGRSFSATHLIFDEMAFAQYADDIWQAASPTLSRTRGRATIISTPKGRANLFAQIFEKQDHMGFETFDYGWWDVPDYNPYYAEYIAAGRNKDGSISKEQKVWIEKAKSGQWYQTQRPSMTDLKWRQEFEGAFDANVGSVFSTRSLEGVFERNYLQLEEDKRGILTEWYTVGKKEGSFYATGIDLGRKNDPTVIVTYDISTKPAMLVDYKYIEAGRAEWDMIQEVILEHLEHWDPECRHDGTGVGDSLSEILYGRSDPFMFTKSAKQNIVELTQHAFDFRQVRLAKVPRLYHEHKRYIWDDKDIEQDTVMANALAISIFHEVEDVFTGFSSEIDFVGALAA